MPVSPGDELLQDGRSKECKKDIAVLWVKPRRELLQVCAVPPRLPLLHGFGTAQACHDSTSPHHEQTGSQFSPTLPRLPRPLSPVKQSYRVALEGISCLYVTV